jgi:hypothetical protein
VDGFQSERDSGLHVQPDRHRAAAAERVREEDAMKKFMVLYMASGADFEKAMKHSTPEQHKKGHGGLDEVDGEEQEVHRGGRGTSRQNQSITSPPL